MTRATIRSVALAVAWRSLHRLFTTPSILLPSLVFPLVFFAAFAGGLSQVSRLPGFNFPSGYTAFQFVFVLLQSAAFGGVFTGFSIARDFETGFARRLLLAAPNRTGIVVGFALAVANPLTRLLEAGRGLLAGHPTEVAFAFLAAVLLVAAFALWALGGLRRAEAAGS